MLSRPRSGRRRPLFIPHPYRLHRTVFHRSEERSAAEVLACAGTRLGPEGADAHNPVFDVTPAALVDCIVTERGVVERPDADKIRALMQDE